MPFFIGKTFPATVATVKCPSDRNNCGNSYNCLTFNRHVSLYTVTSLKLKKLFSHCLKPLPLVLYFLLPPRQDITSLMYPDGFRQVQAVWLRETRQDGLSAPSPCCEETFSAHTLSGKHHCSWRGHF